MKNILFFEYFEDNIFMAYFLHFYLVLSIANNWVQSCSQVGGSLDGWVGPSVGGAKTVTSGLPMSPTVGN